MFRNDFQVLSKEFVLKMFAQALSKNKITCKRNYLNYSSRCPEGVQKRKSNNDDEHYHGQEKSKPSTY